MKKTSLSLVILSFLCVTQAFGANPQPLDPNLLYVKTKNPSALFPRYTEFNNYKKGNTFKDIVYELINRTEKSINTSYRSYLKNLKNKDDVNVKNAEKWFVDLIKTLKPYAGTYHEKTIAELKAEIAEREKNGIIKPFKSKPHFEILYGETIQTLMGDIKNQYSVFQSASDVTGLEGRASYLNSLLLDMQQELQCVQGETASILMFFGTFYRKYLYYFEHGKKFINLLDKVPGFKVKGIDIQCPNKFNEKDYENFKVGYQLNTMAPYETDPTLKKMKYPYLRKKEFAMPVDHAMSFALPYPSGENNIQHAKQILKSTYLATILAAYWAGRRKVYLTLVGGGVYGNKIEWIIDAIAETFPFIAQKNMEVYLVIPSTRNEIRQGPKKHKFKMKNNDDPLRLTIKWAEYR